MRRVLIPLSCLAVLMLLTAACGGGDGAEPAPTATSRAEPTATPTSEPAAGGYQETTVASGGTIAGVVRFEGTPPPATTITIDKDTEICGTSKTNEELLVSASGGIKNAVVSITDITSGKAFAVSSTVTLDQSECAYVPHVLIGRVGRSIEVRNDDPLMHNVHSFTFDNPSINKAQPKDSPAITADLEFPETIQIGCDIHSWMNAWLVVTDHPYYVITGQDGSFNLDNVPPGTYEVEVWHETLGVSSQQVTVTAGGTTQATFSLAQ